MNRENILNSLLPQSQKWLQQQGYCLVVYEAGVKQAQWTRAGHQYLDRIERYSTEEKLE